MGEDEDVNAPRESAKHYFTVWEVDTHNENTPKVAVFESFHNPHPCLRFVRQHNKGGRHRYIITKAKIQ